MTGLRQPWLGITATVVALGLGLLAIAPWSFGVLTGDFGNVAMCTIPFTVVVASFWHGLEPKSVAALPQPLRGTVLLAIAAAVAVVIYTILAVAIGGGKGATPFLAFGIIWSVVVTFWLVVVLGGWPFTLIVDRLVAGGAILAAVYVLTTLATRLLNFSAFSDQPFYPGMDPAGPIPAWDGLVGGVTCLATLFLFLHFDLWPLSRRPAILRQPVLGLVWTPLIVVVGLSAYLLGTRVFGLTPDGFLVAVPVPFMFGTVVLLTMLNGSVTAQLVQPLRGAVSAVAAFIVGTALAGLFMLLMPVLTADVPAAPVPTHLWLASALLGVTFPLMAMYHDFFDLWPLVRSRRAEQAPAAVGGDHSAAGRDEDGLKATLG